MKEFLERFFFGTDGWMSIAIGDVTHPTFTDVPIDVPNDRDVFFSPALRRNRGNLKQDVLGSKFLWVDIDSTVKPLFTYPPTMTVFSGHGWHLYWELCDPIYDIELIERLNKVLIEDVPNADTACWNVNRYLRIPGTMNCKDASPIRVELRAQTPSKYTTDDVIRLEKIDRATRHKIRTGDVRGYKSRSERDWAVISALLGVGISDALIEHIFKHQPVGVKYHEPNGEKYFMLTLQKAKLSRAEPAQKGFSETEDGFVRMTGKGPKRVSTFVIVPKLLLDGSMFGTEDALVCDVRASGYVWEGRTFSRSAFTSVSKLDKETPVAAWQWLGKDDDVRALLPYLLEKLQLIGLPRVSATSVLGLHRIKDTYYFVGTKEVLTTNQYWSAFEGPVAWLPVEREHPELYLVPEYDDNGIAYIRDVVPKLNAPEAIWPMIGWYAATPLKTWFESQNYRFPILNVVGTKGSGKTTLIQRVFMPLFGQTNPKSYDAGTTRFVTLALLGSTNAVPIAFSEFRFDSVERFIRFILLAYDTGHDPRGRSDQTTVDYPLTAPFSVDGEDLVDDPAARERIVVAHLRPQAIEEGSESYTAYRDLSVHGIPPFGGYYIQQLLEYITTGNAMDVLQTARNTVFTEFPSKLPDRVRNNYIVVYTGVLLWCKVVGLEPPTAGVLAESISNVFDVKSGRARTLSDSMVEDIVNAASQGTQSYRWKYDPADGVLWFQLSSAHSWWVASRRRQGRNALERDAMKSQLLESPYTRPPKVVADTWMFGICLREAQEAGLDIPSNIKAGEVTFKFGG